MTTTITEHDCPEHGCYPDECVELLHWLDKCKVCGESMKPNDDTHFAPGICEPRERAEEE